MGVNKKREILFRGKTKDGEWVYGCYYKQKQFYGEKVESDCIIVTDDILSNDLGLDYEEVIPETVGQFTGLIDLNGKKIFEGDIIANYFGEIYGVVEYGESSFDSGILKYTGYFCKPSRVYDDGNLYDESDEDYWDRHQVIGNIHDNPELLKLEKWKKPKEKRNKK